MFSIVNNLKITNWKDFSHIKGVTFDRYTFKDIPEVNDPAVGYNSKGYACSCGTTFVSGYAICPNCGNRHFESEECYDIRFLVLILHQQELVILLVLHQCLIQARLQQEQHP